VLREAAAPSPLRLSQSKHAIYAYHLAGQASGILLKMASRMPLEGSFLLPNPAGGNVFDPSEGLQGTNLLPPPPSRERF